MKVQLSSPGSISSLFELDTDLHQSIVRACGDIRSCQLGSVVVLESSWACSVLDLNSRFGPTHQSERSVTKKEAYFNSVFSWYDDGSQRGNRGNDQHVVASSSAWVEGESI